MAFTNIELRRDTPANWAAYNPILKAGEPGCEMTGSPQRCTALKIGDGVTPWAQLPYVTTPWVDDRNAATLADADALAVAAGKRLVITRVWTTVPTTLSAKDIEILPGGQLAGTGPTYIAGNFQGVPGCFANTRTVTGLHEVKIEWWGARGDYSTDDLPAYTRAVMSAGSDGVVALNGSYYFAGNRPDLTGSWISATAGTRVKVDENPNTASLKLLTPLTIENPVHGTSILKPSNNFPMYLTGRTVPAQPMSASIVDLSTASKYQIVSRATKTAFSGSATSYAASWSSPFASGQEGVFLPVKVGQYQEATFLNTGGGNVDGYVSAALVTSTQRYDFALYSGQAVFKVIGSTDSVITTKTTPNGGAYSLASNGGSVTIGLRLVSSNTVEAYVNGVLMHTLTFPGNVEESAFLTSWQISGTTSIRNVLTYNAYSPVSAKPLSVAIVGDSISYGAWSPIPFSTMLQGVAQYKPGVGDLTVTNHSVSGSSSGYWASNISGYNFASNQYVLVMLGTNDVQGAVSESTFYNNLATITNKIIADGSTPIFGVFPVFTQTSISGVTGVTTSYYANGALLRSAVKRFCAVNGYQWADVEGAIGSSIQWYGDNIHPTAEGHVAIANAFADAISRAAGPKVVDNTRQWFNAALTNSWVAYDTTHYEPGYSVAQGVVRFRGAMKSGLTGSIAFSLPANMRPAKKLRFPVSSINGSTGVHGEIVINPDGSVMVSTGSGTSLLSLDNIQFEL